MKGDLHLPANCFTVNLDTLIADMDSANDNKISKLAFLVRFQSIVQHKGKLVYTYLADLRHSAIDSGFAINWIIPTNISS